jgi:glycosyltransferase involved in cell wall biosynthesis
MNILQVYKYYYPHVGGVERVIQDLAEELHHHHQMQILVCTEAAKGSTEAVNGIPVFRAGTFRTYFSVPLSFTFPVLLRRLAAESDLLHFHLPYPFADVSHLMVRPHGKVVVWWHSDIVRPKRLSRLYRPFLRSFLRKAHAIIVAAPQLIDSSAVLSEFREKCVVIPIGIDTGRFKLDDQVSRRAAQIRNNARAVVLFIGRFVYYKGVEYLIEAMQRVDARLILVGEGPLEASLKAQVALMGLEDKVAFVGRAEEEDIAAYYHACDVFVLPSTAVTEAYGIVQLEAMACGKPVVSTTLPTGVTFVNMHGQTGLTVPPEDSEALARAINELLDDPARRLAYGAFAKMRVEKEFTGDLMVSKVHDLYRRVAG